MRLVPVPSYQNDGVLESKRANLYGVSFEDILASFVLEFSLFLCVHVVPMMLSISQLVQPCMGMTYHVLLWENEGEVSYTINSYIWEMKVYFPNVNMSYEYKVILQLNQVIKRKLEDIWQSLTPVKYLWFFLEYEVA